MSASDSVLLLDAADVAELPEHASPAFLDMVLSWGDGAILQRAAENVPEADVTHVIDVTGSSKSRDVLKLHLAMNRLANRICEFCGWKPGPDRKHHCRLRLCKQCCLAWFCSAEHMDLAATTPGHGEHHLRCRSPATGPLDTGFQAIAIMRTEPS